MVSELGLEELELEIAECIENAIVEAFSSGVETGAYDMLEAINSTAALFNGDSVLHVTFDETTEPIS